ncbi:MAG TPA: tRNA preQ1(34) S-adenosylmethionine ribosyltransferase-isomerase QueA [Ruminococcaceae bacterium]|nr:tRNA preQ1(34) S-adenosylmethionine ribosyltransferase-isomerase QueA [Oscillospiraceae bacterium]
MKKSDFYFELPEEFIAQEHAVPRDHSRMMVLDRESGMVTHAHFYDLTDMLEEGDCLVLNNTRVLPARLFGIRQDTGARVEFVLLTRREKDVWEAIAGPGKKAVPGKEFYFGGGLLKAEVLEILPEGNRLLKMKYQGEFFPLLDKIGEMPLPHYIKRTLGDNDEYQTVYADIPGSAAAPTAGLHFTKPMLDKIAAKGVGIAYLTLHVGLGTFRPVKAEEIERHHMHSEYYSIPAETAELINKTKVAGGRIVCVGTTGCRTLESAALKGGITACEGWTDIFIYPGFKFKCVDRLITNFHLPESTLIMLVSAFAGHRQTMEAYKTAVKEKYRFYSFGDAMLIK